MQKPSLLIVNTTAIMTGLPGAAARHAGPDIRIVDGAVAAIGKLSPDPGERVLDGTDCIAYPAWVNTHHHLFQSILKGDPGGINASLTPWLAATPYKYRACFDEPLFRLAVRIGLVELMRSGCATVADHNYLYYPGMPFDSSAILFEEAEALGLRFVLCRGGATRTRDLEAELPSAMRPETMQSYLDDMTRLIRRYHDPAPDAMRRIVMAPTTPLYSVAPEELRAMAGFARANGIRLHSHLSETVGYQDSAHARYRCSPIEFAANHDWLGADVWFAHLVKLDAGEIRLLGATGTGISHCPQSNGRLGSGIAPIRDLEDAGVAISIGVDGAASNEAADMVSETHAAWLMQRARRGEQARPAYAGGSFEGGADAATVEDVIRWGSTGGAKVLGFSGLDGLRVGQQADIALYRLDDPRYFGLHDPALGPVVSAGRPYVKVLLVGGRAVVQDDAIPGVDLGELGTRARTAVKKMLATT